MDIEIRQFRKALVDYINSVCLPMEVKRLVVVDILTELTKVSDEVVTELLQKRQQEEEIRKQQANQQSAEIVDFEPQKEEKDNGTIT